MQKILVLTMLSILVHQSGLGQNMNSPYSIYGIGDIDHRQYNRTTGMAGTGLAMPSSTYIINNNPAAITGLPRSFLVVQLAATGKSSTYSGTAINLDNSTNKDFWVKSISLAAKVNSFWAINFGLRQFSNVSYQLSGTRQVEGSTALYYTSYQGEGGLNEYYWTNSFRLGKHFSVGVKSSIIAGSIQQNETVYDDNLQSAVEARQKDYFGDAYFRYGLQYHSALNKNWQLQLGGIYSNKTSLSGERTLTITDNSTVVTDDKLLKKISFSLPATYGGGVAFVHKQKTTYAFDFIHEDWASTGIKGNGWKYVNANKLSAGIEFSKPPANWNMPGGQRFYQLGAFYQQSCLELKNTPVKEYGFTTGMGGLLSGNLQYSLSAEYGIRGTTVNNLIRENFLQFTLILSYRDFLFSKGRKYN